MNESDKLITDWEFPWITVNIETRSVICNKCDAQGYIDNWLMFLADHCECNSEFKTGEICQ